MRSRMIATCHPEREHYAKNMCCQCYGTRAYAQPGTAERRRAARAAGPKRPSTCHPDRPALARGMCSACYNAFWYAKPDFRNKVCESRRARYHEDPSSFTERNRRYIETPRGRAGLMVNAARHHAKKLGLPCEISASDIVIPTHCPLLGLELDCAAAPNSPNVPSLDRIHSSIGYVKDNIWVISWRANALKRDGTLAELEKIVKGLRARIAPHLKVAGS